MKHQTSLEYTLAEGWLRPWVEGLREGRAVASVCSRCDRAYFPPLRVCPDCKTPCGNWRDLPGGATIQHRTSGADGDFSLAQFDGATGSAVVRTERLPKDARRGHLAPVSDGRPQLRLEPEAPE